jgi:hypothetical protein
MNMTLQQKVLYHQIHPAKLAADISASVISGYLMWQHEFWLALVIAFGLAIIASALVIRFLDLAWLADSRLGRYTAWHMTRPIEAWRMGGQIVMWIGTWYHQWATIVLGAALVVAAWMFGLVRKRSSQLSAIGCQPDGEEG